MRWHQDNHLNADHGRKKSQEKPKKCPSTVIAFLPRIVAAQSNLQVESAFSTVTCRPGWLRIAGLRLFELACHTASGLWAVTMAESRWKTHPARDARRAVRLVRIDSQRFETGRGRALNSVFYLSVFSTSFSLASPDLALNCPSANPTAFAIDAASWYFCRASLVLPSIS